MDNDMSEIRADRRSLPLQLRERIREMLRAKRYHAGDRLPSEGELATVYGVSRSTVREALKYLEEERVIICRHGLGRFLAANPSDLLFGEITRLQSVTELARGLGIEVATQVLALREEPADDVAQARLDLQPGDRVYVLERARLANQETVIYSVDVFPSSLVAGTLQPGDFEGSLLGVMEGKWHTRLVYSRATISAVLLGADLCQRLNVSCFEPWILMEQVNHNDRDQPILYSKDYHRSDKIQFHVLRKRR